MFLCFYCYEHLWQGHQDASGYSFYFEPSLTAYGNLRYVIFYQESMERTKTENLNTFSNSVI